MNKEVNENHDNKAMERASPVVRELQNQTCIMKTDLPQSLPTNTAMSTQVTNVASMEFHTGANQFSLSAVVIANCKPLPQHTLNH